MTHKGRVHVIGAGLAGLSAAVTLAAKGLPVTLSEAAAQAGGRCRSYHDPSLGMVIDNGNHLILSGNKATMDYLAMTGASDRLTGPDNADFDFMELPNGTAPKGRVWRLRPNEGRFPWWLFCSARRVPGTGLLDYLMLIRLMRAAPGRRIDEVISCRGPLWERLLRPLLVSALNTDPHKADASLAGTIIRETLARGGAACKPRIADPTLAATFVDPALALIKKNGGTIRTGRRLRALRYAEGKLAGLDFGDGEETLAPEDAVILAVPPWVAQDLMPGLDAPDAFHAIVNAHFKCAAPAGTPAMIGVIGGIVEWIFCFEDRISITISHADRLADQDRESLACRIWGEVATLLNIPADLPPWQIVKEKRATFSATPEQNARRPQAGTQWRNLFLAGDWTATALPSTIEGAIRSGAYAARLALPALQG